MQQSRVWGPLALVLCAAACALPPYPSGEITCDPDNRSARCPDGFACLDVHKDQRPVCVRIGCGDGSVDANAATPEQCDDANDNTLDLCSAQCRAARFIPEVTVGFGPGGADPAHAELGQPGAVAVDRNSNIFVASFGSNVVRRLDARAHALTTFLGSGSIVDLGDGRAADPNEVATAVVGGLAADGVGNVYVADMFKTIIRRMDGVSGAVATVVPSRAENQKAGTATQPASTRLPVAVAVDGDGTLFFIDEDLAEPDEGPFKVERIRRLDALTGEMHTVHSGSVDGVVLGFGGLAFDDDGTLYALGIGFLLINKGDQVNILGLPAGCPVSSIQRKLAVSPDGASLFYAAGTDVLRVNLDRGAGAPTLTCHVIASLPAVTDASVPLIDVFQDPGPLDLAFQRGVDGEEAVVVAPDPTNGVVWRIAPDQSTEPRVLIGVSAADEQVAFARDLLAELALQTDGRVGFSETRDCFDATVPPLARLSRPNFEIYAAFPDQHRIVTISCADVISVLAGSGTPGQDDAGGDPQRARLDGPVAAVRALDGNSYIADRGNDAIRVVRRFDEDGVPLPTPTMGTLVNGHGPALAGERLRRPSGLVADDSGRLILSDAGNNRILRVDPATLETDVLMADLLEPSALAFVPYAFAPDILAVAPGCATPPTADPCGMLIVAERSGHRVRAVALAPLPAFTFDLAGAPADAPPLPGDRDAITVDGAVRSELRFPRGLMFDLPSSLDVTATAEALAPTLLLVDGVHRLRRISANLAIQSLPPTVDSQVATLTPLDEDGVGLPSADDAADRSGLLSGPIGMVSLDDDHLIIVERVTGNLRLLTLANGALRTVAGLPEGTPVTDGAALPAAEALPLQGAAGVAFDEEAGVVYVSEAPLRRVRRFQLVDRADPTSWTTDTMPGSDALAEPTGLSFDVGTGDLYVADRGSHTIVRINRAGRRAVVAGQEAQRGFAGDGGGATEALLNAPGGVLFVQRGQRRLLYVADGGNARVRRVDLDAHVISTVLGDGSSGSGGEGAPARAFPVASPRGLAVDAAGNLFVTSGNAVRMLQADTFTDSTSEPGVADGADAVATVYGKPPRSAFPEPVTRCLAALHVPRVAPGGAAPLYAVDSCLGVVLSLRRNE